MSLEFPYLIKNLEELKKYYNNWEIIFERFEKIIN
jgi:hypothetical protein